MADARRIIERWRWGYDWIRPRSSFDNLTLAEFVKRADSATGQSTAVEDSLAKVGRQVIVGGHWGDRGGY